MGLAASTAIREAEPWAVTPGLCLASDEGIDTDEFARQVAQWAAPSCRVDRGSV